MSFEACRFLVCSGVRGDTRRYRSLHFAEQLRLLGQTCQLSHLTSPGFPRLAHQPWSAVFLHRVPYDRFTSRLVEQLRRQGALVIYDCDDLVFVPEAFQWINSPDFADPVRAALYQKMLRTNRRMIEACDGLIVSTEYLAEQARPLGKPVWVHRNAASLEMQVLSEAATSRRQCTADQVVIGYGSGTPTHNRDFEQIKPALQETLARCPQAVLRLVGPLDPGSGWEGLESRIQRLPLVPWRSLPEVLAGFDINLAPLVLDNPFSQSKSEIKYMEAALVSVPTIASPTQAFRHAIRSGDNGFLATDATEWTGMLLDLVHDAGLRRETGQRARASLAAGYTAQVRASELASLLEALYAQFQHPAPWEKASLTAGIPANSANLMQPVQLAQWTAATKDPSNLQLGLYTVLRKGLRALIGQMWIYIRRLLAPIFPFRPAAKSE
jgi:glycosyltransferase involved in cell wall biosynthesis